MINWTKYRALFPHLPDKLYLNHAAISPINIIARTAVQDFFSKRMGTNIEFWPGALDQEH